MTIAVDWDVKQQNKQANNSCKFNESAINNFMTVIFTKNFEMMSQKDKYFCPPCVTVIWYINP